MMEWTHPWMLTGLLGIAWLFHGVRRSLAGMTKAQRWTCLSLRALIFSLIVLALAGPRWIRQVDRLAVVYLLDESLSVPPEAQEKARAFVNESLAARRSDDQAAVLGFAASPRVISPMSEKASVPAWQAPPDQDRKATDIARALESAAALFPPESLKRIVLLSDGNATAGDPVEEAVRLAGEEVRVDTVALAGPERPEVLARELSLPHEIRPGEPFQLTARIQSTVKQAAKVKLLENKFVLGEKTVELQPGENQIDFETRAGENGFHAYETQVEAPSDTRLENNRALATAIISGTPRVLLVEAEEDKARYLSSALRDEHIDVVVRNGLGVPTSLEDLQNFNLFILSDVAALELSPRQMALVRTWVRDLGGSFLMVGGENSFGLGGYYRTPIEEILPVSLEIDKKQDQPSLALVLAIDKSGSMNGAKMELAKSAAGASVELLHKEDEIGVVGFDGSYHWIVPLQARREPREIVQTIASIQAGGGTAIYPALEQAYQALQRSQAKLKHVILLTDGQSNEGDYAALTSRMSQDKITVSTVAIGPDAAVDLLRRIAEWGGGRFYLSEDASNVPQIFTKETMTVSRSSLVEEPFRPKLVRPTALLRGLDWGRAPYLLGYNATKPKPASEVFLTSERDEPIFAVWRCGLGRAGAFTSDAKNRWAAEWLQWGGFSKFWSQVVRGLMRSNQEERYQPSLEETPAGVKVTIDAIDSEGRFQNDLPTTVQVVDPLGQSKPAEVQQTAPGRYEARFVPERLGRYLVQVSQRTPEGEIAHAGSLSYVQSYPPEYLRTTPDGAALREIARAGRGLSNPTPGQVFAREQKVKARADLTSGFLIAALLLFPLDILLRRLDWESFSRTTRTGLAR